ncbi:type I methionyl aminopeptidase [Tumebacillus flagellatus]|uniref:Methionine aminopeptidase n=1 Tax=Tumebacillus flagellatus TaxID=1157490 RepID=A0A074M6W9_9BACL|nr:type I methionyl aminopeptidase [Tumebacillus flagellatus]KEO81757.1 methionine aminopeptidase [Tumebacillus flagellatus]
MIVSKSKVELDLMRDAGRIVALTHKECCLALQPGITTKELDQIADDFIRKQGALPSFKGYHGYPASICASVNDELVHGIPGNRALEEGDIISIDIGANIHGFHGDSAWTWGVGEISETAQKLLDVTEQSLYKGIEQARDGNRLSDIGHAVQTYVEDNGFSVVREYVGHGIGQKMHEDPSIPNYGPAGRGPVLAAGMTLAIEPMVNVGSHETRTLQDNWSVVTADGSLAAHFEHTVVVGEDVAEILTKA